MTEISKQKHYVETKDDIKVSFERLDDGACVITVRGKNMFGQEYTRQEIVNSVAVFDALKKKLQGD